MNRLNKEVTQLLDHLQHPLRKEIEQLRKVILTANDALEENIKWNGPNYSHNKEDRITMRVQPPKQVQLIFHRGAKTVTLPADRLITDASGLLVWKTNDRAVATFASAADVNANREALKMIINDWIAATVAI